MSNLMIGLLSTMLATNQAGAASNLITQTTGLSVRVPNPNDPLELEYQRLLEADDAAQAEADEWIQAAQQENGSPTTPATLRPRIEQRFAPVREAYESFLQRNPGHTRARLAYGSFLSDTGREVAAAAQWEKARELEPANPTAWNNLANYYGHNGPVTNAFRYYARAIELNPREPIYLQNFATTVYMFRRDAMEYYQCTEAQVFDRAMELYRKALALDPENFILASDLAQSYYGMKPRKTGDAAADRAAMSKLAKSAIAAWTATLKLARDEVERQGTVLHIVRWQINAGQMEAARKNLALVTNAMYAQTCQRLERKMAGGEEFIRPAPEAELSTNSTSLQAVSPGGFGERKLQLRREE